MNTAAIPVLGSFEKTAVENELRQKGACMVKGSTLGALDVARALGTPRAHDARGTLDWAIRPAEERRGDGAVARSHTSAEFRLHSDACFEEPPPSHLVMKVDRADRLGGGLSVLLPVKELVSRLDDADKTALKRPVVLKVPAEFFKNQHTCRAALLGGTETNPWLRWRRELVVEADDQQKQVLDRVDRLLAELEPVQVALEDGDLIVLDNRTWLHGRTEVLDSNRLLWRCRFDSPLVTI